MALTGICPLFTYSTLSAWNDVKVVIFKKQKIETNTPLLLLWNDRVILLEYAGNIWLMLEDLGWLLMEVSMGSIFDGALDTAVVVPEIWKQDC